MRLLHIDSSILGGASASRTLSAAVVDHLREVTPDLEFEYRDLVADPIPHLTVDVLAELAESEALQQFLRADVVVIGAALYNFTVSAQLNAWLDRILVAGRTFRYGADGPEGLAGDKRVIIALTRGGFYGADSASASAEHAETLLRTVLAFIGVRDPEFIIAEGLKVSEESRRTAMDAALRQARSLEPWPAAMRAA